MFFYRTGKYIYSIARIETCVCVCVCVGNNFERIHRQHLRINPRTIIVLNFRHRNVFVYRYVLFDFFFFPHSIVVFFSCLNSIIYNRLNLIKFNLLSVAIYYNVRDYINVTATTDLVSYRPYIMALWVAGIESETVKTLNFCARVEARNKNVFNTKLIINIVANYGLILQLLFFSKKIEFILFDRVFHFALTTTTFEKYLTLRFCSLFAWSIFVCY